MKKVLSLILVLCMCVTFLVACNDNDTSKDSGTSKPADSSTKVDDTEDTDPVTPPAGDGEGEGEGEGSGSGEGEGSGSGEGEGSGSGSGSGEGEGNTPDPSVITIATTADWTALATDGDPDKADFANKTVKLTADINFGTAAIPTLFKTFAGTFDGGNFSVKGTGTASRMSVLANKLDGATVKNVKFEGITVNSPVEGAEGQGIVAASAVSTNTAVTAITLENITVKLCTVVLDNVTGGNKGASFVVGLIDGVNVNAKSITVSACKMTDSKGTGANVGGVIGYLNAPACNKFEEIKVDVDIQRGQGDTGGVIGCIANGALAYVEMNKIDVKGIFVDRSGSGGSTCIGGVIGGNRGDGAAKAGNSFIKNVSVDAKFFQSTQYGCVGAITGFWGKSKALGTDLTIENGYVKGEISFIRKGTAQKGNIGTLVGSYGSYNSTLNVTNVVIEVALNQPSMEYVAGLAIVTPDVTKLPDMDAGKGQVYGYKTGNATANVAGSYTTIQYKLSDGSALALDAGLTAVAAAKTAAMVQTDANGFVSAIVAPAA